MLKLKFFEFRNIEKKLFENMYQNFDVLTQKNVFLAVANFSAATLLLIQKLLLIYHFVAETI